MRHVIGPITISRRQTTRSSHIGADFIHFYGFLIDLKNSRLIDQETKLYTTGQVTTTNIPSIKVIAGNSPYHGLLLQYPEITRPLGRAAQVKHNTRHHINTTPGPPASSKPRRLAPDKYQAARKSFEIMLELGTARPSSSSWSAPLHLVAKKDNEWRPCGDYRALNARTIPDQYCIPHIHDFTLQLRKTKVYSKIDLIKAYNQIPVAKEDIPKTAITTPFGLYEFPYMSFGLRNAAQTFQRFMDEVLRGLNFCFTYIDDVLVAGGRARATFANGIRTFQAIRDRH